MSAYELSDRKYPALLAKAKEVADKMAFAWVGVCTTHRFCLSAKIKRHHRKTTFLSVI